MGFSAGEVVAGALSGICNLASPAQPLAMAIINENDARINALSLFKLKPVAGHPAPAGATTNFVFIR
jgi:hypothetical protein